MSVVVFYSCSLGFYQHVPWVPSLEGQGQEAGPGDHDHQVYVGTWDWYWDSTDTGPESYAWIWSTFQSFSQNVLKFSQLWSDIMSKKKSV